MLVLYTEVSRAVRAREIEATSFSTRLVLLISKALKFGRRRIMEEVCAGRGDVPGFGLDLIPLFSVRITCSDGRN